MRYWKKADYPGMKHHTGSRHLRISGKLIWPLAVCLLCFSPYTFLNAQELEWNVRFHGFADNREYAQSGRHSQTLFGARLSPEIGIRMDSIHRIRAGVSFLHEFGASNPSKAFLPTLYYNYQDKRFDFYIGMFPRHELIGDYPRAILADTIVYFRPNIEGMLWRYENKKIRQQIWIDWTGRQTEVDREQFMAGISGKVNVHLFYFSHYALLRHEAGTSVSDPAKPVRDNAAAMASIGLNLSNHTPLDSLDISVGGIITFDRLRGIYDWRTPKGFNAHVHAEYRKFFIDNTTYLGEPLDLPSGDPFYTSERYNRLDIGWIPLRYKNLEGRFILGFHFTPGAVDNQQQFLLRYNIGNSHQMRKSRQ